MMKYLFGLLALCFCLGLSIDVGAVEQPVKTEFIQAQAPVFCESIEVDFACVPTFSEATAIVPYSQPGESHGNLRRLCSSSLEAVATHYLSLQVEAKSSEQCRKCTTERMTSAFAKEDFNITNSDWKVGWQA